MVKQANAQEMSEANLRFLCCGQAGGSSDHLSIIGSHVGLRLTTSSSSPVSCRQTLTSLSNYRLGPVIIAE